MFCPEGDMLKALLKKAVAGLGYEIRRKKVSGGDLPAEIGELIGRVRAYTMLSQERLLTLYENVIYCEENGISGDFVECGVWKGGAVALMALANLRHGSARRGIHLFDAFTDICEPDKEVDGERAIREAKELSRGGGVGGKLVPLEGFYDTMGGTGTLEGNKRLLEGEIGYDPNFLHYHPGWFQDTLPKDAAQIKRVAILRLDADWYASTKICLEYLYGKVVKGGIVIVDDYGCYEGCRKAVDEWRRDKKIADYLHRIDAEGRYWIKA
jgi:O-methyltransferase